MLAAARRGELHRPSPSLRYGTVKSTHTLSFSPILFSVSGSLQSFFFTACTLNAQPEHFRVYRGQVEKWRQRVHFLKNKKKKKKKKKENELTLQKVESHLLLHNKRSHIPCFDS